MIEIKLNCSSCKLQISVLSDHCTLCILCVFNEKIPLFKDQVFTVLQMKSLLIWDSTKFPIINYPRNHILLKN